MILISSFPLMVIAIFKIIFNLLTKTISFSFYHTNCHASWLSWSHLISFILVDTQSMRHSDISLFGTMILWTMLAIYYWSTRIWKILLLIFKFGFFILYCKKIKTCILFFFGIQLEHIIALEFEIFNSWSYCTKLISL